MILPTKWPDPVLSFNLLSTIQAHSSLSETALTMLQLPIWFSLLGFLVLCAMTFHRCQLPFPGSKDLASFEHPYYSSASLGEPLDTTNYENDLDEEQELVLDNDDNGELEEKAEDDGEEMYLRRSYSDREDAAMARWRERLSRVGNNRKG